MAMTTDRRTSGLARVRATPGGRQPSRLTRSVGHLFLWTSGVHVGIVVADTEFYRRFADGALPVVREAWSGVFMASPALWGLAVSLGELLIGLATLRGGRWTLLGLSGAIGFHLCLMLFGWGFWLWSLPMLALLVLGVVRESRRVSCTGRRRRGGSAFSRAVDRAAGECSAGARVARARRPRCRRVSRIAPDAGGEQGLSGLLVGHDRRLAEPAVAVGVVAVVVGVDQDAHWPVRQRPDRLPGRDRALFGRAGVQGHHRMQAGVVDPPQTIRLDVAVEPVGDQLQHAGAQRLARGAGGGPELPSPDCGVPHAVPTPQGARWLRRTWPRRRDRQ